ncbi:MAG: protein kinase [Deltaproteobacteria bacterium]|nr:protein kinase [Deltaproteobacteria bacterium]
MPERIGRYEILAELGRGAMATVYLGRAEGLAGVGRLFAIKIIHENLSSDQRFVRLFLNEARIAARLHHPNVVPVYDVDADDGAYFLSMDYVSGETLSLLLRYTWNEGRPFSVDLVSQIVAAAAEGLHAAHELRDARGELLGVIHRDVAPKNILVGYDGVVRVMDFGIAKALDSLSQTNPGIFRGTAPYMAPEQVVGEPMDRRVDVFALGIVLFEATLGRRLFKAESEVETLRRVVSAPIPRPSEIDPAYPKQLESIVLKALSRKPAERFSSARELSDALLDDLVSRGKRPSASELEGFMRGLLGPRLAERRALERESQAAPRSASEVMRALTSTAQAPDVATRDAPQLDRTRVDKRPGAEPASPGPRDFATAVLAAPDQAQTASTVEVPEAARLPPPLPHKAGSPLRPSTPPEEVSYDDETERYVPELHREPGPPAASSPSFLASEPPGPRRIADDISSEVPKDDLAPPPKPVALPPKPRPSDPIDAAAIAKPRGPALVIAGIVAVVGGGLVFTISSADEDEKPRLTSVGVDARTDIAPVKAPMGGRDASLVTDASPAVDALSPVIDTNARNDEPPRAGPRREDRLGREGNRREEREAPQREERLDREEPRRVESDRRPVDDVPARSPEPPDAGVRPALFKGDDL